MGLDMSSSSMRVFNLRLSKPQVLTFASIFLASTLLVALGDDRPDTSSYSNADLLSRANRSFAMRNFLASEKYFRELTRRLSNLLSQQEPSESLKQIEIDEELILAPFGLGHTLIYLHKYNEAKEQLEKGLKIYPDWALNHVEMDFFKDPNFTGPVVSDLQERVSASGDSVPYLLLGYIQFFSEDYHQAKDSFSKALKADQSSSVAKYFLEKISLASRQNLGIHLRQPALDKGHKIPSGELNSHGDSSFRNSEDAIISLFRITPAPASSATP